MQTLDHRSKDEAATVKVMGPRHLVETLVEFIESEFYAVRTSNYRQNSKNTGVHIYLKILGSRQ